VGGEQRAQLPGAPGQQHRYPIPGGRDRARYDLVRSMITAHGVHGDRPRPGAFARHPSVRRLAARGDGVRRAAAQGAADRAGGAVRACVTQSRMRSASHRLTGRVSPARPQPQGQPRTRGTGRNRPRSGRHETCAAGKQRGGESGNHRRGQNVCQVGDLSATASGPSQQPPVTSKRPSDGLAAGNPVEFLTVL